VGFALGPVGLATPHGLMTMALGTVIFNTISFTIIGCMARVDRFKHLFIVAIVGWLISSINFVFMPMVMKVPLSLQQWFIGLGVALSTMGLGGALSFVFVRSSGRSTDATAT
jgi:hypothetical protein